MAFQMLIYALIKVILQSLHELISELCYGCPNLLCFICMVNSVINSKVKILQYILKTNRGKNILNSSVSCNILLLIVRYPQQFINAHSKVYSKKKFHLLSRSKKVTPKLLSINVCFTNKQLYKNIKVDDFFLYAKLGKVFGKLMFYFSIQGIIFSLLSVVLLFSQEVTLGTAVSPFILPFPFFVMLSSSSAFDKW